MQPESEQVVMDPETVSVILACRDAEQHLAAQLLALAAQDYPLPWELVVSDNGSTDGTLEVVEQHCSLFQSVRVIDSSGRTGPAAARNAGVRAARGRRLVFCDADDVVAPGWLTAMSEGLDAHPFVAARLEHHRLNEAWSVSFRNPQTGLLQTEPPFLPYTFTASMGVRREIHDAVGGFDERLTTCEDRDYCYRVQLTGARLRLAPEAVVHYRHRTSARDIYRQSRAYGIGNVQMYSAYRQYGLGRPPLGQAVLSWLATPVKLLPALTSRRRLAVFAARTGWRVGRLQGSVRYRVWAL
ncbi:MAG: glycosyltransferase [Marmoricola sp.]